MTAQQRDKSKSISQPSQSFTSNRNQRRIGVHKRRRFHTAIFLSVSFVTYLTWEAISEGTQRRSTIALPFDSGSARIYDEVVYLDVDDPSRSSGALKATSSRIPPPPRLMWIYVNEWREGMAAWIESVSQVLVLASTMNATLAEPCIDGGRLTPCSTTEASFLKLSDVFDLSPFASLLVSEAEFHEKTSAVSKDNRFEFCLTFRSKSVLADCGSVPNRARIPVIPELQAAQDIVHKQATDQGETMTVVNITSLWKNTLWDVKIDGKTTSLKPMVRQLVQTQLKFRSEHYEFIDALLSFSNLDSFSVLQWRAEKDGLDYVSCAREIVRSKHHIFNNTIAASRKAAAATNKNHTLILMSNLQSDASNVWNGSSRNFTEKHETSSNNTNTPAEALNLLFQDGFINLEQLLDTWHAKQANDNYDRFLHPQMRRSLLPVWDLILAHRAHEFSTCSRTCRNKNQGVETSSNSFCTQCNYLGKFSDYALMLRHSTGQESDKCWNIPTPL